MKSPSRKSFITAYIHSLTERSRLEKKSIKYGIDWVVYNYGLSKNWTPIRLPFIRQFNAESPKAKTEAEFGIDSSFIDDKKQELIVFVLKDEVLNNKNWISHDFSTDLSKAVYPDLSGNGLSTVKSVRVILVFNKDEDHTGSELFERFVSGSNKTLNDNIPLSIQKWNLDILVEKISESLLTPDLLPQNLSGSLSYLCGLVSRIKFGTKEWSYQVVLSWRNYLSQILENPIDERKIRLVALSLIILSESQREDEPTSHPGWIDLIEWGMIELWRKCKNLNDDLIIEVVKVWSSLYLKELEIYVDQASLVMKIEHGLIGNHRGVGLLNAINDGYVAFWNLTRLGLFNLAAQEILSQETDVDKQIINKLLFESTEILLKAFRVNPACLRPLIDLDHITIFLLWLPLWQLGRKDEIYKWLFELERRLLMRRVDKAGIPFIEGRNNLELLSEYIATGKKPPEFVDTSSYLLLMVLELCFGLDEEERDLLINLYYKQIVTGDDIDNNKFVSNKTGQELKKINLLWWAPPEDWCEKILEGPVTDGVSVAFIPNPLEKGKDKIEASSFLDFVTKSRSKFPFVLNKSVPLSVYILCCIKYRSPLPSEFWRGSIFPIDKTESPPP